MSPWLSVATGLITLVVGAELLVRGSAWIAEALGIRPLIVGLTVSGDGSPEAEARQVALQEAVIEALRRQPGVTGVGLVNNFPLASGSAANGTFIEMTRPDEITTFAQFDLTDPRLKLMSGSAEYRQVSGEYFKTMAIPLLELRGQIAMFDDIIFARAATVKNLRAAVSGGAP